MPARSMARPIMPSSASISRTRWPLPSPPIAGLHDISPIRSARMVISATDAPIRAAAAAASQPAWPPPTTMTSKLIVMLCPFSKNCRSWRLLCRVFAYFPIQKAEKILPRSSSTSISPVIRPSATAAMRKSSAAISGTCWKS